ncbi:hypothetical protein ACFP2T_20085 [Plantactinospora solaniradicis]|uniref:Uncharacterized protein n=1 Tax=Plantactinospora solaniradicis TaxID=1723736 RepID=A0ABW1K9M0_9ACTN
MDIDGVKTTIRAGSRAAKAGAKILEQAASEAAEADALARVTIHDSEHEYAQKALDGMAGLAREVEVTLRRFTAAVEHADAYVRALG